MKRLIVISALIGAFSLSHANLVVNGDFESDPYPANGFLAPLTSLTGWNIDPLGNVAGLGTGYLGDPSQAIDLSGVSDGTGSGINQTLTDSAGREYDLTFDVYVPYSGAITYSLNGVAVASGLGAGSYSYSFFSTGSDNLNFTSDYGNTTHLDNVVVDAVPGPAAALIPGLGMGWSFISRRRRSSK